MIGAAQPGQHRMAPAGPPARVTAHLPTLIAHIADAYSLGAPTSWSVLTTGYEDLNIEVTTNPAGPVAEPSGHYVVKVFATGRGHELAARTAGLIAAARAAGVRHPALHCDRSGRVVHRYHAPGTGTAHQVLVMDFVPGRSLYDLQRAPTRDELADVLDQALRIHRITAQPWFVFDPWAVGNLAALSRDLHDVVDTEQRRHVDAALRAYTAIAHTELPATLIHGDLTKGNVLIPQPSVRRPAGEGRAPAAPTPTAGDVVVLDFAVANRLPRVQELSVVAANLCHGAGEPLSQRADTVGALYSDAAAATGDAPLSETERAALQAYTRAGAAMELLGALAEWHAGNRNAETSYLIDLGLAGLRSYRTG